MKKIMIVLSTPPTKENMLRSIWIMYPPTEDDGSVAKEVRAFCQVLKSSEDIGGGKTGMFFVADYEINGRYVLVASLEKKIILSELETITIQAQCEQLFKKNFI